MYSLTASVYNTMFTSKVATFEKPQSLDSNVFEIKTTIFWREVMSSFV